MFNVDHKALVNHKKAYLYFYAGVGLSIYAYSLNLSFIFSKSSPEIPQSIELGVAFSVLLALFSSIIFYIKSSGLMKAVYNIKPYCMGLSLLNVIVLLHSIYLIAPTISLIFTKFFTPKSIILPLC